MSVSEILRHPQLKPFYAHESFIPRRSFNNPIFPNSEIVRNKANELFIQSTQRVPKQRLHDLLKDLLSLVVISKHEEFIRMKYFKIKQILKDQKEQITVIVYYEHVGDLLEKYVRMKKNSKNPVISQNVMLQYLLTLSRSIHVLHQLGYLRHGHLNLYTIRLYNQKLKVAYNPLFPLTCLKMLELQPSLEYFENCFLSPQQLDKLKQQKNVQITQKTDVYVIGIIILNLATLHLFQNCCYLPYSRQDASIDQNHIDQKLSYVTQYYSQQFFKLLSSMLQEDPSNRISSLNLYNNIEGIFKKRKIKERKYVHTLVSIYGKKGYKDVDYKLKFDGKDQTMQQLRISHKKDVEDVAVFRGTFGRQSKQQGYYDLPQQQQEDMQKQYNSSKSKKQEDTQKKKPKVKSKKQVQLSDAQQQKSTHKKQSFKSKKEPPSQYAVNLQKQLDQYCESKKKDKSFDEIQSPQKFKYQIKPDLSIIPQQLSDNSYRKIELLPTKISQQQKQENKSNHFLVCSKLQKQGQLMFEINSPQFQTIKGQNVPIRKYFKPPTANQLINKFDTKGVMIGLNLHYGNIVNGRRHGLGLQIFPEGDYYYGYFQEDLFHGVGTYWWSPTHYFIGKYHYGEKIHGWMINDTRTYFGTYLKNRKQGKGINFDQTQIYQGYWNHGKKQGQGIIYYANGDTFKGEWMNGKKNGKGTQKTFKSNTQIFAQWVNDQPVQPVEVRFSNGHIYRGNYTNGQRTGNGQYIFSDGSKFQGIFKDNSCYEGVFHYCDGSIYKGRVNKSTKREGYGVYIDQDGTKYEGQWYNNLKNGKGTLTTNTFTKIGIWKQGYLLQGVIHTNNGNQTKISNGQQLL